MEGPGDSSEDRVLVFTAFAADGEHTARLLATVGITAQVCSDATSLCGSIEEGAGALFLAEETLVPATARALLTTLEKQPAWSDLPIVVSVLERELLGAGYGLVGSLGTRANIALIERPVNAQTMVNAVRGALRARRRQYSARSLIDELAMARRQAEESSRAKDDFLATLSHELRTPLNAILGWTRMLRGGTLAPEKRQQALLTVERNAIAQTRLIDDLLDVSRALAGKVTVRLCPLDPVGPIQAAIDSLRPVTEAKGIRLVANLDPSAGPILGDADRVQQVLWNLLNNAIKFTPKGGKVEVSLSRDGDAAEVAVCDSGIGMSPSFLPHVFDRFRQADSSTTRAFGGLGIGLSIVKTFVELHGGTVFAASEGPGRGSTFVVRLPLALGAVPPVPSDDMLSQGQSARDPQLGHGSLRLSGLRVLVVDDEPETADLFARVLQDDGATVLVAESASAGYDMLVREGPDVLVSDIGMPTQDGYEFIRRVRSSSERPQAHIPALAVTAYARLEDRARALTAGFDMYVSKPVTPVQLVAMVETLAKRSPDSYAAR